MDKSKTPALQEMKKERDHWYGQAQDRAIRINNLADNLKEKNTRIEELQAQVDELKHKANVYDAMCDVGLIQFDESIPDCIYSVWGFGAWHHAEDIFKAIADAMEPPSLSAAIKGESDAV